MTAREKAREAAINKAWSEGSEMVESGDGRLADLADAASDIWEPLVRDLLADIDGLRHQHNWLVHQDSYRAAKAALDT